MISIAMITVIWFVEFPRVVLGENERIETGAALKTLLTNRTVWLFFIGIFAYVGTEQGIANWLSKFLQVYHGIDPETTGASVIAWFWLLLTIGCVLGLILLKLFDSRKVLVTFSIGAMISLAFGLFGSAEMSVYGFPAAGFFLSVMWSVIISLGLNSVPKHHGTFSGILCTGIIGGAMVPLLIGGVAEKTGLRTAMCFIFITLTYVLSVGIWAKPLVNNVTVKSFRDLFRL